MFQYSKAIKIPPPLAELASHLVYSNSHGHCHRRLRSSPTYVNYYTGPFNYTISAGDNLYSVIQLAMRDIWGNDITDPDKILVDFINGPAYTDDQPSTLSSQIKVNCYNDDSQFESSLLYIHPLQFPGVAITINFDDPSCNFHCGYCYSPAGSSGSCPSTYIYAENMNQHTCAEGREGILCGNCSEGYAVAINDPDLSCTQCNYQYGVAIFLLLQLVPVLIMLTLMAVLHIKIIDGHLSGFVLFSQMVTLQFPGLGYSSWVPNVHGCGGFPIYIVDFYILSIPLTVYSIWNLNFLNLDPSPFCIPLIDTAAEAIFLQYTTAACPLVFIMVTYTWIKCYNNGYRLVVYTTRPVHQLLARFWQKFKIQPALIDTYAGLMLLSYMRFLATSAKLLKYTIVTMELHYIIMILSCYGVCSELSSDSMVTIVYYKQLPSC